MAFFKNYTAGRSLRKNHARRHPRRPAFRPRLETLEDRQLLATFDVAAGDIRELIDAILAANSNNEDDVINLNAAQDFIFTKPAENGNALPILRSDNNHSLTINGNGAVFDASTASPVVRFLELDPKSNVVINHVTFFDGTAPSGAPHFGRGGAIFNNGTLTLANARFEQNGAVLGGAIYSTGQLDISRSTLEMNSALGVNSLGAGIYNIGDLRVDQTEFRHNLTNGLFGGGAIRNEGWMEVTHSVFENNINISDAVGVRGAGAISERTRAGANSIIQFSTFHRNDAVQGGAITVESGRLQVFNSTFSQNATFSPSNQPITGPGGAILVTNGHLDVSNSTFSNNRSRNTGGAITALNNATGVIVSSTFTDNFATLGGGGLAFSPNTSFTLFSNIVAGNGRGVRLETSIPDDIQGGVAAASSHNLVGALGAASGIAHGVNNNLVGSVASPLDPRLGPLQDNGGPTQTHALLPGSPAINAGFNAAGVPFDQRGPGFLRGIGGAVDIGAFEFAAANRAPIANPQSLNIDEDETVAITLTGDDGDPGVSQILTFAIARPPVNGGIVSFQPNGQVVYAPHPDFNGVDTFTFTVTDNGSPPLTSAQATVTINVAPINDPPTASPQDVSTDEDTPLAVMLGGGDGDAEAAQSLTFSIVDLPTHGTLSSFNSSTGAAVYTPDPDYFGPDSFTFQVTDDATAGGPALTSAAATVSITVNSVNDPPVADVGGPYLISEGDAVSLDASGSFDVDAGDVLFYRWDIDGDGDFDENVSGAAPTLSWSELIALGIDDGPDSRTIAVEVSDGLAAEINLASLTIDNAPPTALVSGPGDSVPGFERSFTFSAADASPADQAAPFIYTIDWGDGSPVLQFTGPAGGVTLTHAYAQLGQFIIEATATDKDGGVSAAAQHPVDVRPVAVIDGDVFVGGTATGDRIIVFRGFSDLRVRIDLETFVGLMPDANGRIVVFGLEGDDVITVAGHVELPTELHGGDGNDYLAGNEYDGALFGGPGDDRLLGGEGNNLLDGGEGDDYLAARSGNDTLLGGPGADRLYAGDGDNIVDGGEGDDQISAGAGRDLIRGGDGADVINARGGDDIVLGGAGNDRLFGDLGRDLLIGGSGADMLHGGADEDILIGGATAHDDNDAALLAVLAEWTSASAFPTRIANLTSGANSLASGNSVLDDGQRDDLLGGTNPDWLFQLALDQLCDLQPEDQVVR